MSVDKVEQQIIQATIDCIEKFGLAGVTNRRIAELANVNHAAINYYFRSKENLISRVMEITAKMVFDWDQFDAQPGASSKERCIFIFENMVKGGCEYPEMMRAHFYGIMNHLDIDMSPYRIFIINLSKDLMTRGTKLNQEELQLALIQIASACLMIVLVPNLNIPEFNLDLQNEEIRHHFVTELVNKLLTK